MLRVSGAKRLMRADMQVLLRDARLHGFGVAGSPSNGNSLCDATVGSLRLLD